MKKTRTERAVNTAIALVYGYAVLKMTHPDTCEQIETRGLELWNRARHRVSVWQALKAIKSLPEV